MRRTQSTVAALLVATACATEAAERTEAVPGSGTGIAPGSAAATGASPAADGEPAAPEVPAEPPTEAGPRADVVAVSVSGSAGAYTFSVSIESDDVDCSQYANWWEVLDASGALLYRRILEHSHTDANGTTDPGAPGNTFTRTGGPVAVDADADVVVRAHMSSGGYGGRAMRGSVAGGFAAAPDLGATFAGSVEGAPPQPGRCQF